jgi:hypothetical protein
MPQQILADRILYEPPVRMWYIGIHMVQIIDSNSVRMWYIGIHMAKIIDSKNVVYWYTYGTNN